MAHARGVSMSSGRGASWVVSDALQQLENPVANGAAHRVEVESVCRVDNLQIPLTPESIKSQPSHKCRDGRMNMDKVVFMLVHQASDSFDHGEISQIKQIAAPSCLPGVVKRGLAQRVLLHSIRQGIDAPPFGLEVRRNREKKGAECNRNR